MKMLPQLIILFECISDRYGSECFHLVKKITQSMLSN